MAATETVMTVIRASRPSFRNPADKVAFAVHASFLASGYVLTATGRAASSDSAFSAASSSDEVGIDNWNELDEEYAFVYAKPEKGSKKVLVKCLVMNDKVMVNALSDGDSAPVHLEIQISDYIEEDGGTNYAAQFKNFSKLVQSLNTEILSKFECSSAGGSSSKPSGQKNEVPQTNEVPKEKSGVRDVEIDEPTCPQYHPSGIVYPPVIPTGQDDLYPGPGAGMYPTRGFFGSGGSLLVGPGDPRWFSGDGQSDFPGAGLGIPPPGARFDPYGPPGVPGFEPNRFVRNPRRPPGGEIHPDLQHFGGGSGLFGGRTHPDFGGGSGGFI